MRQMALHHSMTKKNEKVEERGC